MNGIENDLASLESLIRQLEYEYDQFFSGQIRAEPQKTDKEVQTLVRAYSARAIQNAGLRFRYMNLVARYNAFRRVWSRKVREREEGREFGRPMKAAAGLSPPSAIDAPSRKARFTVEKAERPEEMKEIFEAYRDLRTESGESVERLRLESFTRIIGEKVKKIKESKKCEKVEIRLRRDKDKTRILVRPSKD